jgi:predicted O-methyltransferase YrrM
MGNLFTFLVQSRRPDLVVEVGAAFGVSGMYFLAGIEFNGQGRLLTFEPNEIWAKVAKQNLSQISKRFLLVNGTFEENIEESLRLDERIELAFIDAIHTKKVVVPQLNKVVAKSASKALTILDDINFSDDMRACWQELAVQSRFAASVAFGDRVGVLELAE